jgi:hypothetical protein
MKINRKPTPMVMTLVLITAMFTSSTRADDPPQPQTSTNATNSPAIAYHAPAHSLGLKRSVNAGSRSSEISHTTLAVLAPEGLGSSATGAPRFWWYISEPFTNRVEFSLNRGTETVLKSTLTESGAAGLHAIDLSQLPGVSKPIKLEAGVDYQWTIRLRLGDDPATQPVSVGWVSWQAPDSAAAEQLSAAPPANKPSVYADKGYWYDAIDALAGGYPTDRQMTAQLRSMLDQAGLNTISLQR